VSPKGAVQGADFSKKLVDALDAIKWSEDHLSSSDVSVQLIGCLFFFFLF